MEVDYIIVGQGIAGTCFAQQLIINKKSFVVIDGYKNESASIVSAGLFNPVVLKRFTSVWRSKEELNQLNISYRLFEILLKKKYLYPIPVFRIFKNQDEHRLWVKKSLQEELKPYLELEKEIKDKTINAPYGLGKVNQTGRISVRELLQDFRAYLTNSNLLIKETFDYNEINFGLDKESCVYKTIKAKKIVFCEGFAMKSNPYFKDLPLLGNKGEVLVLKLNHPISHSVYKSKVFLSPYEQNLNYLGATYNWEDKDIRRTDEAKKFLKESFETMYNQKYEVIDHWVGMRATVQDRRPLVGIHPKDKRLVVFNGLGTRGIMNGPLMAKELFDLIEYNKEMNPEVSITRFNTKFAF